MATMNVSVPDDLVEFVQEETKEGGYTSNSEVVREGLRLLRARRQKRRLLLHALELGHDDTVAGRTTPLTEARILEIAARARERARERGI